MMQTVEEGGGEMRGIDGETAKWEIKKKEKSPIKQRVRSIYIYPHKQHSAATFYLIVCASYILIGSQAALRVNL